MIHHFLINPAAGRKNQADSLVRKITHSCQEAGVEYRIHTTARPGDATAYVRAAAAASTEPQRFYACGGDGTLSETINGAPDAPHVEFAVIPAGTGNDFVRNFRDPENFLSIDCQLRGRPERLDLLRYNDRYCINMINIGFDCNVVKKTGEIKRSPLVPSGLAYATGVGITLCRRFGTRMHITLADGTVLHDTLLLTAIANGGYCGGGFHSNPRAALQDGLLDLCAIQRVSRARFLSLIGLYKAGTHLESEKTQDVIQYFQTPEVLFTFDDPVDICVDGEIEMTDRVRITVAPRHIAFSVPYGSALACPAPATTEEAGQLTAAPV